MTAQSQKREVLCVYQLEDGTFEIEVGVTWADDPENRRPQRLSQEVAEAVRRALGGSEAAVQEFRYVTRPMGPMH